MAHTHIQVCTIRKQASKVTLQAFEYSNYEPQVKVCGKIRVLYYRLWYTAYHQSPLTFQEAFLFLPDSLCFFHRQPIQYAECGFGVIRIPVAWSNMMDENYTIHPDYITRVKEITDWTIDGSQIYHI